MDCEKARDRFSSLWEKELAPFEEKMLGEHLSSCPECRREFEQFEKTMGWLHSAEEVEVPEGFLSELYKKREEKKGAIPFEKPRGKWLHFPLSFQTSRPGGGYGGRRFPGPLPHQDDTDGRGPLERDKTTLFAPFLAGKAGTGIDPFGGAGPHLWRRGRGAPLRLNPERAFTFGSAGFPSRAKPRGRPGSRRGDSKRRSGGPWEHLRRHLAQKILNRRNPPSQERKKEKGSMLQKPLPQRPRSWRINKWNQREQRERKPHLQSLERLRKNWLPGRNPLLPPSHLKKSS